MPIGKICDALGPAGTVEKGTSRKATGVFHDTFDWRLYRRELLLKGPPGDSTGDLLLEKAGSLSPIARARGSVPRFVGGLPPGRLRDALEPVLEMRALLPLVRLESRVTPLLLRNRDGKIVLRLSLKENRVFPVEGGKGRTLRRRLQLDPVKGYGKSRMRAAALLAESLALPPLKAGLFEEALEAVGRMPGTYSSKAAFRLDPSQSAREAVASILLALLGTMEVNEEGTLQGTDTEFLHDFRVAVRRTRSALVQLRKLFPSRPFERFRREFAWLGTATGPARDMDVYLLDFPRYREELPEEFRDDLEPLRTFLDKRQRREYRAVAKVLRSARYRRLKESWRRFLEKPLSPRSLPVAGRQPVADIARRRIRKTLRRVVREGKAIDASSPPERLHELRITCKKLRYLLEFFQSLFPREEMKVLIRALKGLQDNLGEFQDLHVQGASLQAFSRSLEESGSAPPRTFVAIGMLVEGKKVREGRCRREFSKRFRVFTAAPNRRLFEKNFPKAPKEEGGA